MGLAHAGPLPISNESTKVILKFCKRCKDPKAIDGFSFQNTSKGLRHSWCKACVNEYRKSHKKRASSKVRVKELRRSLKDEVIAGYGGKCKCCGESERKFLTLDHVNGREGMTRNQLRSGLHYREAKREGYPAKYQVLCYNCNCAKGFYGVCPHTLTQTVETMNVGNPSSIFEQCPS